MSVNVLYDRQHDTFVLTLVSSNNANVMFKYCLKCFNKIIILNKTAGTNIIPISQKHIIYVYYVILV